MLRFLRHLGILIGNVVGYARRHKSWWLVPLLLILLAFAALIILSQASTPFIYTLF